MRLILVSSLFLILSTCFSLSAQDSTASVPEPETSSSPKTEPNTPSEKNEKAETPDEETITAAETETTDDIKEAPKEAETEIVELPDDNTNADETAETKTAVDDTKETPVAVEKEKPVEAVSDMDIVVEEDEDLLLVDEDEEGLLITDDGEENLLAEEKKDTARKDTVSAQGKPSDETQASTPEELVGESDDEIQEKETIIGETGEVTEQGQEEVEVLEAEKKPVVVEKTRSIDFAKNLKEYRSPKRAMFMSLLLPGLGQAYTKKYWKTALFGVIEAAIIGFSVKYALDGRDKKEEARDFADLYYNPNKFFQFYQDFAQYTEPESMNVDDDLTFIFGETLEQYKAKYTDIKNKSHDYKYRQDYDRDIGTNPFVQGWDDCELHFDPSSGYILDDAAYAYHYTYYTSDTLWIVNMTSKDGADTLQSGIYGYSAKQGKYNDIMSRSNHLYTISGNIIFLLLANHIISAVDAFISARAYNGKLLNKKSVWQHINLDQQIAFTEKGIESRYGIRVRF
jgi:hypothetical protein